MLPTPFALFVAIAAWRANEETILRTFMLCCLFGATAAFTLPSLGNAPITPAVAMVPVLVWRALAGRKINDALRHLVPGRAGFWLMIMFVWGAFTAVVMPRLFAGETYVFSTSRSSDFLGVSRSLLAPNSTNITQTAYLALSLVVFVAVSLLLESKGRAEKFSMAVIYLGVANAIVAVLGLVEFELGVIGPVALLKNASYTVFDSYEIGGLVRITGAFAEASGFAGFTIPLMAFVGSLWSSGFRRQVTGPLAFVLLALLLFSTSSTAYVAVGLYAVFLALSAAWQSIVPGGRRFALGWGSGLCGMAAVAACLAILLAPEAFTTAWQFLDVMVVRKLESESGLERSSWNAQAWVNTMDTLGLGAGLGSVRASSFPLVLVSNVGFLGAGLFLAFVVRAAVPPSEFVNDHVAITRLAARHAMLAALIAASLAAGVFDLGSMFYAFAAAAAIPATAPTSKAAEEQPRHAAG